MLSYKMHPEMDFKSPKTVRSFQFEKIKNQIHYVSQCSPFYKELFHKEKIKPEKIKTWKDFQHIPFTTKDRLRTRNTDFFCQPKGKWADVFTTSGTTGGVVYFPVTKRDLARTAYAEKRCLEIAGIRSDDVVQFHMPMSTGMWGAGVSYYLGYQLIGACVLRTGPGNAEQQIQNMKTMQATVIHSQAGFLYRLGVMANQQGIMEQLKVRFLLAGLENILCEDLARNELGKKLEQVWQNSRVCAVYGNTESASPVNECEAKQGYHLTPEFCYYEVINRETGKPVDEGEHGMLVITPLDMQGLPLIRYELGDVSFLFTGKCACKRTAPRLGPIIGRTDDQIKIKGVSVYPSAIENAVLSVPEAGPYFIEVYKDENFMDQVKVAVAPGPPLPQEKWDELSAKVNSAIQSRLHFSARVEVTKQADIQARVQPPGSTKPRKFFDLRK